MQLADLSVPFRTGQYERLIARTNHPFTGGFDYNSLCKRNEPNWILFVNNPLIHLKSELNLNVNLMLYVVGKGNSFNVSLISYKRM